MNRRLVIWGVLTAIGILASTAMAAQLTVQCPAYLVPGHRNVLNYHLSGTAAPLTGQLALSAVDGARTPLVTMPVRLRPGQHEIIYQGSGLPAQSMRYRVRLTAGQCTAEGASEVKAWDLIGCFYDPVTEEEKRQLDAERSAVPEGYDPDSDPFTDDEAAHEPHPYLYCAGINPATVTTRQIAAKAWYWDQPEQAATRLYITPGVPSYQISLSDWQHVWGHSPAKKKWYDDQGAAFYTLNGVFYTTNPGQYLTVKLHIAKDGAKDNAGNECGEANGIILEQITIDGQGQVSGHYFTAVSHQAASVYRGSPQPPRPPKLTRFQRFWPVYQAHIADILAEREQRDTVFYREGLEAMHQTETRLKEHEAELLAQLREQAQHRHSHHLDFEGEALENAICIPSSDAAARIFTQLLHENLVTATSLIGRSGYWPEFLSPGWVTLIGTLQHDLPPHSGYWKAASLLLYRAGVNEPQHRQVLEQAATAGDAQMLYYLFFTIDRETGRPRPRANDANDALLARLAGPASPPGIRAVCAAYAAATGKTALAESISIAVCALPYTAGNAKDAPPSQQDEELSRARLSCGLYPGLLETLFYRVRTEKAFRVILERSDAYRAQQYGNIPLPAAWRSQIGNTSFKFECEAADSMIYELKAYMKQHSK